MATKKKPKYALFRNRPKWAKPLTADLWKHLCEDAFEGRPILAGVKRNRTAQLKRSIRCFECEAVARLLGLE